MDARDLLAAGPDGFVAARDAEVKRLRHEGDKAGAQRLKALKRPTRGLWAVLVAGQDRELVAAAIDSTAALLQVQTEPGSRERLARAIDARRAAVQAVVDAAVAALTEREPAAAVPRDEIGTIVDRVSRHPELAGAWLDGTLRDIPDDTGFGAFEGSPVLAPVTGRAGLNAGGERASGADGDDPRTAGSQPAADDDRHTRAAAAEAKRRAQQVALAEARQREAAAARAADKAEQALASAERTAQQAADALAAAQERARATTAALDRARSAAAAAHEARDAARRDVAALQDGPA